MLSLRRLRWLGHVQRIENCHLPKDLLYGQLNVENVIKYAPILETETHVLGTSNQQTQQ